MAQRQVLEKQNEKQDKRLHELSSRRKQSDENARKQVDQVIQNVFTSFAPSFVNGYLKFSQLKVICRSVVFPYMRLYKSLTGYLQGLPEHFDSTVLYCCVERGNSFGRTVYFKNENIKFVDAQETPALVYLVW